MADQNRPRFGEKGYTQTDARNDVEQLEKAVLRGPEAVENFYETRGGATFTERALGIACRWGGLETVQALLRHGAAFVHECWDEGPRRRTSDWYETLILRGLPHLVRQKKRSVLPRDERLAIVRELIADGRSDLSELLYQSILAREFEMTDLLIEAGTKLSENRIALLDRSSGFFNHTLGVSPEDREAFRKAIREADNPDLIKMITFLRRLSGIDRIAVYDLDICDIKFCTGQKEILPRFQSRDMLIFMLENTTMRRVVTRRMLVELLVEQNDAEGLEWLIRNKFLNRRPEIAMLREVLDAAPGEHPEMYAMAVAHDAAHPPKDTSLSIPTDPLAASVLRKIWQYETAQDGKSVRILRYKGDGPSVAIPPRIGRRTVREIAEDALTPRDPTPKHRRLFGYVPLSAAYQCVSFPGTIRSIPACLSREAHTNAGEILLEDGIETIEDEAFHGTSICSITVPDSISSIGTGVFRECEKLVNAKLPAGLRTIADNLFRNCRSLAAIPDCGEVESIGSHAFVGTSIRKADLSGVQRIGECAFLGCENLSEVILSDELTEIPNGLFRKCKSLRTVPSCLGVTRIGKEAFAESGLEQITLGDKITFIGQEAFACCPKLTSVVLGDMIRDLSDGAFRDCTALTMISIPAELKSIGEQALRGCSSLETIDFPAGLQMIGYAAFSGTACTRVLVPANTKLSASTFSDCIQLQSVQLEEGTQKLPDRTFAGCTALENVQLPNTLRQIGECAFMNCSALRTIELPEWTQNGRALRIGVRAFSGTGLETVQVPNDARVGAMAFAHCGQLTALELPSSMLKIPNGLCEECKSLLEIRLPDGITKIGTRAFAGSGLREVVIPDTVTEIAEGAFAGSQLERIVLPDTVTTFGQGVFSGCTQLKEVVLPSGLREIPVEMFSGCKSLVEIHLPDTLQKIGASAFMRSGLERVRIPKSVQKIPIAAFQQCVHLREADLGAVKTVLPHAFRGCVNLAKLELPETLNAIGESAFAASGLEQVRIPRNVLIVPNNAFSRCTKLRLADLGDVSKIAKTAFAGCTNLAEVRLPDGLAYIEKRAFERCGLTRIRIPESVIQVGSHAFCDCAKLSEVDVNRQWTQVSRSAFRGTPLDPGRRKGGKETTEGDNA